MIKENRQRNGHLSFYGWLQKFAHPYCLQMTKGTYFFQNSKNFRKGWAPQLQTRSKESQHTNVLFPTGFPSLCTKQLHYGEKLETELLTKQEMANPANMM